MGQDGGTGCSLYSNEVGVGQDVVCTIMRWGWTGCSLYSNEVGVGQDVVCTLTRWGWDRM